MRRQKWDNRKWRDTVRKFCPNPGRFRSLFLQKYFLYSFFCLTGEVRCEGMLFPVVICTHTTNEGNISRITEDYNQCYSLLEMKICTDESRLCDYCNQAVRGPWGCFAGFQKFRKLSHSEGKFQQNNLPTYFTCQRGHADQTDFCMQCIICTHPMIINGFSLTDPCIEIAPIMDRIWNVEKEDYTEFLFTFVSKLQKHHRKLNYRDQEKQLLASIEFSLDLWLEDLKSRNGKYVGKEVFKKGFFGFLHQAQRWMSRTS